MSSPRPVAIVVQTHWDREWYYTHQRFIARLLVVMERVATQLESGKLKYFLFDGQTAAYEDLLEHAEPALIDRVKRLVREKRVILGPWYVMADEFLVCGESLVRNLEIGIADATAAGNCQRVGYLPDTFGHIGQMPQLLRAFGITSSVMWRGADSAHAEFEWQSPDGSSVGTVFLTQGYYQQPLNVTDWQTALTRYLGQVTPRSLADEVLLTQGGDHLMSVDALAARIAAFNASQTHYVLQERTLSEHVDTVLAVTIDKRNVLKGELRNNAQAFVLPDVLSTRRYLKRLNQAAEDTLLGVIEPLLAQLDLGTPYPARYLDKCWRMVVQQQAHDSICGCSIDAVHREMLTRYAQLDERFATLIERISADAGMIANAEHEPDGETVFADDDRFTLFNPLPKRHQGQVICKLFFRGERRDGLTIQNAIGAPLSCEVLSISTHAIFRSPIDEFPDRIPGYLYEVLIHADIDGLASLACVVNWGESMPDLALPNNNSSNHRHHISTVHSIENARLRVSISQGGEVSLEDKINCTVTTKFFSLLSELDAGDSYNFSPPPHQQQIHQTTFKLVSVNVHKHMEEMCLQVEMNVPQGLREDRHGASAALVMNQGTLRLRLFGDKGNDKGTDTDALDCQLTWTNRAQDQRTRLLLPLPEKIDCTYSDVAFDWVARPVVHADYPTKISRQEMPVVVNPSSSAITAGNLTFCHRAMQEYEVLKHQGIQYLGVTLVRSVGWMSRRDLVTRGVGAGPDMETPEAQCLGNECFEFQISLLNGAPPIKALAQAERFRRPPIQLRGHATCWREPIDLGNDMLQTSAVRRVANEIELRVWNPTDAIQTIAFNLTRSGWRRVDADGSLSALPAAMVTPYTIATLRKPL
jgi:mannosylglycerate hydrolase